MTTTRSLLPAALTASWTEWDSHIFAKALFSFSRRLPFFLLTLIVPWLGRST